MKIIVKPKCSGTIKLPGMEPKPCGERNPYHLVHCQDVLIGGCDKYFCLYYCWPEHWKDHDDQ